MIVYLGSYTSIALWAIGGAHRKRLGFLFFVSVFLIWFMGFRYETGCDYGGYLHRWYLLSSSLRFDQIFSNSESGFLFLMAGSKAVGLSYTEFNVVVSSLLVFCYVSFAKGHLHPPLIIALLFPIIIIQLGMSGIRQALAGGFIMLAFNSFSKGQKLWTAMYVLLGMQFHTSAAIFLPMAVFAGQAVNTKKLIMSLLIAGPIVSILLGERLDTYEDRYFDGEVTSGGAPIRYALLLLPIPFFIAYRRKLRRAYPNMFPLLKISAILIICLFPLLFLSSIALHRLTYYIMPLSILLCVYLSFTAFKKPLFAHFLLVFVYGSYSFFWFLSSRHAQTCYIPYWNTWFF